MRRSILPAISLAFIVFDSVRAFALQSAELQADLLIVGGNESACAAAAQAARLGVKNIVLVNDIDWLGGQFSAEGVGCLDEWTTVNGRRVNFPRSGLFLEVVRSMQAHNSLVYGKANPGNAYCGTETIEPAAIATIFEDLLRPHVASNVLRIERGWQPERVHVEAGKITSVDFEPANGGAERLQIKARLTIDASDWGDVIRLSGAKYGAGPDLKSRFDEPSAPAQFDEAGALEMNPISWCIVLRECGSDATIPRPATYDPRSFAALDQTPPWVDSDMGAGIYSQSGWSIYTHRRLVDRLHNGFAPGTEALFLNWPVQDYPLCQLPQRVIDALEQSEAGASKKNIVDLKPAQRRIIFEDAKQHALGMLYHLQTAVHERVGDFPQSFRYLQRSEEFGTPDHLPPKPYVREGLRLEALYMLREQDIRSSSPEPKWARVMPMDSAFAFQFNIDFHPTRRKFLSEDRNGPWQYIHTPARSWHTDTDRAVFPLRGLVPIERDGLLGAGKNIGVSSVVQSALRLHGQMMHVGQASATLAWMSLRDGIEPRSIVTNWGKVREVQLRLVRGCGGPGVLLWPWQDLTPEDAHFEAVNMLAVRGIWPPEPDRVSFQAEQTMTRRELAWLLARLCQNLPNAKAWPPLQAPIYSDISADDPDRASIEALIAWGDFQPIAPRFSPDSPANAGTMHDWLKRLGLPASAGSKLPLSRSEAAQEVWRILRLCGERSLP